MDANETSQALHDRATRGLPLTDDERSRLDAWYTLLDEEETRLLKAAGSAQDLTAVRSQIDSSIRRVLDVTRRIQELAEENDTLRQEIRALKEALHEDPQWAGRSL